MIKVKSIITALSMVLVCTLVVVFVGQSFAFFNYEKGGETLNVVTFNGLSVEIENESTDAFNLTGAYPEYDFEGMNRTPLEFTITSHSGRTINYTLKVVNDTDKQSECLIEGTNTICPAMTTDNVKYSYKIDDSDWSEPANLGANNNIVFTDTIVKNDTVNVSIKIWIDSYATNEIENSYFYGKLVLEATKSQEEKVKVTFNANGGTTGIASKTVVPGETYGNLPIPTKDGYIFKGWQLKKLPSEYQSLEYIESNGTQWIDTGIKGKSSIKIDTTLANKDLTISTHFMGSRESYMVNGIGISKQYDATLLSTRFAFGTEVYDIQDSSGSINTEEINHYVLDKNGAYVNDTLMSNVNSSSFESNYNIYVFTANDGGNAHQQKSSIRLYQLKLYDNNTIVREFIPCYRISDNIIGLYDIVNNAFYTNQGTGTFIKGDGEYIGNMVTSTTQVTESNNHTLTAIWEAN